MSKQYPQFVQDIEKTDPVLFQTVATLFDQAMTPGELDAKTKILIALAIDAFDHSPEGVRSLSNTARNMGITNGQIAEALRIAYLISGNKTLTASQAAFKE